MFLNRSLAYLQREMLQFAMISQRFPKPPLQNGELDRMMSMVRAGGQFQLLNGNSLGISHSKKTGR